MRGRKRYWKKLLAVKRTKPLTDGERRLVQRILDKAYGRLSLPEKLHAQASAFLDIFTEELG